MSERFQLGEYWLSLRENSEAWCRTWFDKRKRQTRRNSLGTTDFEQAKVRLAKWYLEQRELKNEPPQGVLIGEILDRYVRERGPQIESEADARRAAELWKEHYEMQSLDALTKKGQEAFVTFLRGKRYRDKPYSDGYINRILGVGATALQYAVDQEWILSAPRIRNVEVTGEQKARRLTLEQMAAFFNACDKRTEHVWEWGFWSIQTLGRPDAVLRLAKPQLDCDERLIHLLPPGEKQSKKRRATVPLTTSALPYAENAPPGYLITYKHQKGHRPLKSIRMGFERVRDRAGLPADVTPRSLRRTMARELRRRGVSKWDIGGAMGHKSKRGGGSTTEVYAEFEPDWQGPLAQAIDAYVAELSALLTRPMVPLRSSCVLVPSVGASIVVAKSLNELVEVGRREWDRTTDHHHVKVPLSVVSQRLKRS